MGTYSLLVKGNAVLARMVAVLRGVKPEKVFALREGESMVTGVCDVRVLHEWFGEVPNDSPFPVGTLLYFSRCDGGAQ